MYRYRSSQWKSLRTTNGIERLYLEFRRRVKTQGSLQSAPFCGRALDRM
jgi:transposase-like protein